MMSPESLEQLAVFSWFNCTDICSDLCQRKELDKSTHNVFFIDFRKRFILVEGETGLQRSAAGLAGD
jgi:hypothetical protein